MKLIWTAIVWDGESEQTIVHITYDRLMEVIEENGWDVVDVWGSKD